MYVIYKNPSSFLFLSYTSKMVDDIGGIVPFIIIQTQEDEIKIMHDLLAR